MRPPLGVHVRPYSGTRIVFHNSLGSFLLASVNCRAASFWNSLRPNHFRVGGAHEQRRQEARKDILSVWEELRAPDGFPYWYDYISGAWTFQMPNYVIASGHLPRGQASNITRNIRGQTASSS